MAETVVEPSEEAGESARTFRVLTILPPVVETDAVDAEDAPTMAAAAAETELTRSRSFLASASTVRAEPLTVVVAGCVAGATETGCILKAEPPARLTAVTFPTEPEALLLLLMESSVGARFLTPRIGEPSASRLRMKLDTSVFAPTGTGICMGKALTVAPPPVVVGTAPVVTLTEVCSGITMC